MPTSTELREHFIEIDKIASEDIYDDVFKYALRAQKRHNKNIKIEYFGRFYLIKILKPRIGESKNSPLFFDSPFLCINKNKYNLKLMSVITGQVVRRHPSQVKEIRLSSVKQVRNSLPDEILQQLQLISFKGLQETIPVGERLHGPVTRSKKVRDKEDNDFSSEDEVTFA